MRQKGIKISLGQLEKPAPVIRLTKDEAIEQLREYLVYDRQFSKVNVDSVITAARGMMERYGFTTPTTEAARAVQDDMKGRGLSNNTVRHRMYYLEYLAASQGIVLRVEKPRKIKTQPSYLSMVEARQLLDAANNKRDKAILAVLLYCGLRSGELCNLEMQDIDLPKRLLYVRGQTKNYEERKAVLTVECADLLREWVHARPVLGVPYLFVSVNGRQLDRNTLDFIIKKVAERAGIGKRVYCHQLRHSCATAMLRSGVPITEVQLQLGHRSLSSTLIYVHGDLRGLRESVDRKFKY